MLKLKDTTKEVGKASEEASKKGVEGAKENTKHVEGLHRATGFLYRQFGELGHLLHGFTSLPALGITAIGIGLHYVSEKADEFRKKIIETRKEIEDLNAAKLQGLNSEISSALDELKKFKLEMAHAGDPGDPITQEFKERRARLEAEAKAKGGALTPEQDRALLLEELKKRQAAAPWLNASATAAFNKANAPDQELIAASAALAIATAKTPGLQEALREASTPAKLQMATAAAMGPTGQAWLAQTIAGQGGDAQAALNANQGEILEAQGVIDARNSGRLSLRDAASTAKAQFTGNAKRITELGGGLGVMDASSAGTLAGSLPSMPANSPTAKLVEYLRAHGETNAQIISLVNMLFDQTKSTKEKLAAIESRVSSMNQRP